jgi:hypothetical protein
MNIPLKHKDFIKHIAEGETQSNAYKLSIGKSGVSKQVCEVKGSQLAKKYALEIEQERKKLSDIVEQANQSKVAQIASMDIMTKAQRLEYLTKVINGEIKVKKPIVISGKIMEYPMETDMNDRLKALAELNKMDGSYAPIKNDVSIIKPNYPEWMNDGDESKS